MPAQTRLLTVRLQQQVADKIGTGPRAVIEARSHFSRLPCAYSRDRHPTVQFYPVDLTGGERGTRTLDLGIMSRYLVDRINIFNNLPRGARCNWHHRAQRSSTESRKTHASVTG